MVKKSKRWNFDPIFNNNIYQSSKHDKRSFQRLKMPNIPKIIGKTPPIPIRSHPIKAWSIAGIFNKTIPTAIQRTMLDINMIVIEP